MFQSALISILLVALVPSVGVSCLGTFFHELLSFGPSSAWADPPCKDQPDGTPCSDGNICDGDETCQAEHCSPGIPLECDDDDVCTDDLCIAPFGCVYSNNNASCSDGNACTVGDACTVACVSAAPRATRARRATPR